MIEKKPFCRPEITTYRRDELVVETAFTGRPPSAMDSDRQLKTGIRPVSGRRTLAVLLRL